MNPGLLDSKSKIHSSRGPREQQMHRHDKFQCGRETAPSLALYKETASQRFPLNGFDCAIIKLIASAEDNTIKFATLS